MAAPAFFEISGSPKPEWYEDHKGRNQFRAWRLLDCAWEDRRQLIDWLYSEQGSGYPHDDGTPSAIVRRVIPEGWGRTSGTAILIAYPRATLRVFYDTAGPVWVNGLYLNEEIVPHPYFIRPGGKNLFWSDGTPCEGEDYIGRYITGAQWIIEKGRLTTAPYNPFSAMSGVNGSMKYTYTLGYTFAAQQCLYNCPAISSHSEIYGGTKYKAIYRSDCNPKGWNKFWHAATNDWEYLYHPDDSQYVQYPVTW